ncbi:AbiV family abortive infection protein [Halalkalibacter sp. APA_J-10(15)]|uniref:AbiV family abortive infection protein n=1 Tax=Halalkalibacter sp. APA_J-10(15) TaxID=2933805 RepID=UPI001FF4EBD8|nr:AbiV family abortive infection protein [Halalkalibacter sp. APA_J-10(15)]MCK0470878.1 AbiV family abortive infection protein [Halalkalibacter sp. APA_J-10(15)]
MSKLSFNKLEHAYRMVFENAKELIEEAKILYEHKKYARAYALAQIAHEELAKLPIIFHEATRMYYGERNNWKSFNRRLRSHEYKNSLNHLLIKAGNLKTGLPEKMEDDVREVNNLKNSSLYADFKNNNYTKPTQEFNAIKAEEKIIIAVKQFDIWEQAEYHEEGNIKKFLHTDEGKDLAIAFEGIGLIKSKIE